MLALALDDLFLEVANCLAGLEKILLQILLCRLAAATAGFLLGLEVRLFGAVLFPLLAVLGPVRHRRATKLCTELAELLALAIPLLKFDPLGFRAAAAFIGARLLGDALNVVLGAV